MPQVLRELVRRFEQVAGNMRSTQEEIKKAAGALEAQTVHENRAALGPALRLALVPLDLRDDAHDVATHLRKLFSVPTD